MDAVLESLVESGLTRNEALAYLTLLEADAGEGLTGYEVAQRSRIPRSAVYAVLHRLEERGAAFRHGEEPVRYVATAPDRLVAEMRRATLDRLARLESALAAVPRRPRIEPIRVVNAYDDVLDAAAAMIGSAARDLALSGWARELDRLRAPLEEAAGRGATVLVHCLDRLDPAPAGAATWCAGRDAAEGWAHRLVLVVDGREALVGGAEPGADNQAVRTANPSIADIATNHVLLDVTLLALRTGRDAGPDVAPFMRPGLGRPAD